VAPPLPITSPPPPKGLARLRGSFTHTGRTLGLVWRSSRFGTATLAVLTVISAALGPAIAYVGKLIVDAVVAARGAQPEVSEAALRQALVWVGLELGLVVSAALMERALGLVRQLVGARLGIDVNVMILEKALTLKLSHFEDSEFYDKLTRARREASSRPLALVQENFQVLRNGLTLAGYIALLVAFSPWLVALLLVATVPAFAAEVSFSMAGFRLRNWRAPEARRLNYLEYVMANDEHAKEVKLFGLGQLLLGRYKGLAENIYTEDRRLAVRRTAWGFSLSLLSTLAFYGCYGLIVLATVRGRLSLGDMTLYLIAFRQGQQAFQSILTAVGGMYEDTLYMSNLFEFLGIPTGDGGGGNGVRALPAGAAPEPEPAPAAAAAPVEQGIRFDKVGFRYPGSETWALRGIDVFIPRGQSLALVGQNGAGKTTFIKLLTRLYEPTEGRVLLDGKDLRAWDETALRRRVGVIFQDFNQYYFLFRENVGVGSVEHLEDRPRIEGAIERGGARELVDSLTQGLDTQLGRWFQGGVELSGGQWQKVALARAFMRQEADILVLDEPTAALDAEAEHAIFQRFRALAEGRTTILISHRFPTVRMADRILVIERGHIVEEGSHERLVAANGRYAQLFALQAQGYL
jgi:ATP-binding cassette subfamily B protein